jgi:hypothetical protein
MIMTGLGNWGVLIVLSQLVSLSCWIKKYAAVLCVWSGKLGLFSPLVLERVGVNNDLPVNKVPMEEKRDATVISQKQE